MNEYQSMIGNGTKLSVALGIIFFFAWMFLLRPIGLGGPATYIIVSGRSMEPTFYTGDFVLSLDRNTYKVGDIITFWVKDALVIHRIVGGNATDGFIVQGDNKPYPDIWHPVQEQILGRVWFRVPGLGAYLLQARQPLIFTAFVGIMYCLLITPWVVGITKEAKKKDKRRRLIKQRRRQRELTRYMSLRMARKLSHIIES